MHIKNNNKPSPCWLLRVIRIGERKLYTYANNLLHASCFCFRSAPQFIIHLFHIVVVLFCRLNSSLLNLVAISAPTNALSTTIIATPTAAGVPSENSHTTGNSSVTIRSSHTMTHSVDQGNKNNTNTYVQSMQ